MSAALSQVLFDPVSYLPEWQDAVLTADERSALNAVLVEGFGPLPAQPYGADMPELARCVVEAWHVLAEVGLLIACARRRQFVMADRNWPALPTSLHHFMLLDLPPGNTDAELAVGSAARPASLVNRYLLGATRHLPHWLAVRLRARYPATGGALPVDVSTLRLAIRHAQDHQ